MTFRPRLRRGAARSVPVLLLLVFSSAGFVAPAGAAPRGASSVDQEVLTFANLLPGESALRYLVLTVQEPSVGTVVRAEVEGSPDLLPFVVTGLRSCEVAWQAGACAAGEQTLLPSGSVPASQVLTIPVQAQDALYLQVEVGVSDDVPQGTAGTLFYVVGLEGAGVAPPTPSPTPTPTTSPTPSPTEAPVVRPPVNPPTQPPGNAPLPRTGAEILATLVAALSLIGLGGAVRTAARRRRAR